MKVKVIKNIFNANEAIAIKNREILSQHKIFSINLMSAPGAGKTSLILQTVRKLKDKVKIAVIEGDVASQLDADKIKKEGAIVIQINTGGGCSLDANMVSQALESLPLTQVDLLLIENIGNLICPAQFTLGEHKRVVISSLPEGDDKPIKYPIIFSGADAVVINKIDLLPYLDFNLDNFQKIVAGLNPKAKIFQVSSKTGTDIEQWCSWILAEMKGSLEK